MNLSEQLYLEDHTMAIRAEQAVIGALLVSNDALDRISELEPADFYRHDHRIIYAELKPQIAANKRADAVTLAEVLGDKGEDCMRYCANLRHSAASSANIRRHADIIIDKASKRALAALALEMQEMASSPQPAAVCIDQVAAKLEAMGQRGSDDEPKLMSETISDYLTVLTQRMEGAIKPISTGHVDLDARLDGGLERGTLTVVAGRAWAKPPSAWASRATSAATAACRYS